MDEAKTLLLSETGIEILPDGSTAVNVGPIVRALAFLTEGRGEDRGIDEAGNPLPDLMSLAFDVIEAIIVGGKKADYFRQVKRDLEAQTSDAQSSLKLAKEARRVHTPAPATALDHAAESLQALLAQLATRSLTPEAAHKVELALESFRAFGVDRWVSATAQLLVAAGTLGPLVAPSPSEVESPEAPRARKKRKPTTRKQREASAPVKRPQKRAATKTAKKPKKAASKAPGAKAREKPGATKRRR